VEEGLSAAQERKLFISPAINGWVLVIGSHLPDPSDDIDHCFRFLSELSRKVGQVQFFSVNRAVNHHAWVQLQHGQVQRAYAWAGKTIGTRAARALRKWNLDCGATITPRDRNALSSDKTIRCITTQNGFVCWRGGGALIRRPSMRDGLRNRRDHRRDLSFQGALVLSGAARGAIFSDDSHAKRAALMPLTTKARL